MTRHITVTIDRETSYVCEYYDRAGSESTADGECIACREIATEQTWSFDGHGINDVEGVRIATGQQGLRQTDNQRYRACLTLMAAAPQLLEAVTRLEAGVRLWISRGVTDEDMQIARDAIAAARS